MITVIFDRRRLSGLRMPEGGWLYLGKDPRRLAELRARHGAFAQLDITERLNAVAKSLRQPFLDEIARIGALQGDLVAWHSTSFAWKHPGVSDLFLLTCYRALLERLAKDQSGRALTVWIEDPWLFLQCRRDMAFSKVVRFEGESPSLWVLRARLRGRLFLSRAAWLVRTTAGWMRQRAASRGKAGVPERVDCLIYSMPHPRCFTEDGGWRDPFLGGLERLLEREGLSWRRLAPTGVFGFERDLADRAGLVVPLILSASWAGLVRSLFARWAPAGLESFSVGGMRLDLIADREHRVDQGCARWCESCFFYECMRRLLSTSSVSRVIYPFEQQPWEKMIVLAREGTATSAIGYQHSIAPEFFLPYFLGAGEVRSAPLPEMVLTAGDLPRRRLIQGGHVSSRVRDAGSFRYGYLSRETPRDGGSTRRAAAADGSKRVLVVVAHDPAVAASLVGAVNASFPDHGREGGLAFHFRPHPTFQALRSRDADWMTTVEGDLSAQLGRFDVVVASGSTVVFEARLKGVPVVVYSPETFLDVSALPDLLPDRWVRYAGAPGLRAAVREAAAEGQLDVPAELTALRDDLFGAVNPKAWREALERRKAESSGGSRP